MRIRATGIVALWIVAAIVTAAAAPCVAGAMMAQPGQMAACVGGHDDSISSSSGAAMDCCTHTVPSLAAAKSDPVKAPVRDVEPWLTSADAVVLAATTASIISAESPPGATASLDPPRYIVLGTLLI